MLKVKGNDSLVRDENSRAIINTDSNGLKQARKAKHLAMKRVQREQELENRVEYLEQMLESINNRLNDNA